MVPFIHLLHPVGLFVLSAGAVKRAARGMEKGLGARYILFAVIPYLVILAYLFTLVVARYGCTGWAGRIPAGAMFWNIVTCYDRLILRGWNSNNYFTHGQDGNGSPMDEEEGHPCENSDEALGARMEFGSEVTRQARGIDRFWEVKNVPPFSRMDPNFVPSKGAFLLVQLVAVVACYYAHNLTVEYTFSLDQELLGSNYIPLFTRAANVSGAELKVRIIASLGYWIIQYCSMQFFYSVFALFGSFVDGQETKLWRPLFGSPEDAYTLKNLWG